jgi:glycosyltransferase involved in cell wall biosynthesis
LLVSVILSVKNGDKYIADCIDSILFQNYKNFEFIIIDDGSTDNTKLIIDSYIDSRIKYIFQQNNGLAYSLNKAISIAKGDLIIRQDADDISSPNRLKNLVELYSKYGDKYFYTSNVIIIDTNKNLLYLKKNINYSDKKFQNYVNPFTHGSLAFPRKIVDKFKYDINFNTSQDFDLLIRILDKYSFKSTDEFDYIFRIHESSVTSKKWKSQVLNKILIYKKYNNKTIKFKFSLVILLNLFFKNLIITLIFIPSNNLGQYYYRIASIHFNQGRYKLAFLNSIKVFKRSPLLFLNYFLFFKINFNICKKRKYL